MGRFWNLRTKLVAVLVVVLSGTFLLQSVIHEHNEQQLLLELEKVALDIANDTGELIAEHTRARLFPPGGEGENDAMFAPGVAPRAQSASPKGIAVFVRRPAREGRQPSSTRVRVPAGTTASAQRQGEEFVILFNLEQLDLAGARIQEERERYLEIMRQRGESFEALRQILEASRAGEVAPPPVPVEFASAPAIDDTPGAIPSTNLSGFETLSVEATSSSSADTFGVVADAEEISPPTLDVTPYIDRVQKLFNSSKRHDLIATVGVFLIGIALAWFLGVRVTRPVDEVVHGFQRLAEGEFDARVPERPGEEFGHLGRQFNAMVERLRDGRELERELSQRERIQHMGDLAAGVAHDVRNPLNAIHLNIGQIRDEFVPTEERSRERFLRFTSDVQREVERLNQLVTNFLSLARPAARESEPVDPNELVDELFRLLRKEATGRDVELALELSEGLPSCSWNRQDVKSAFLNIAINAIQALAEKGGHLVISTARRVSPDGEELVVAFSDDGPGIPPEDLERVFVPYYTTRKGGTGLGMVIARRTAERHGGRLELRSIVGEGTRVSFVFPCAAGGVSA